MSIRQQQFEAQLQRTMGSAIQRNLADPRVRGMVSVTRVTASPNHREATIFVSVLPKKYERRTLTALNHAAGHLQRLIRDSMAVRVVPQLRFKLDDSVKKQLAIHRAINIGFEQEEPTA